MIRCAHCSAPLPAYSGVCAYCGGRSEADRAVLAGAAAADRDARYPCPVCAQPMRTVALSVGEKKLVIDKCGLCFGLFFPAYGLETVLADSARLGALVDVRRLAEMERNAPAETGVAYRKCPACAKIMNRVNFGSRSGVVTDRCRDHGTWLDAGELRRLLDWQESGGAVLEAARRRDLEREAERRRRRDAERVARWRAQGGSAEA